jgi:hypothetical protein
MDKVASDASIEEKIPASIIRIVGHPVYEHLSFPINLETAIKSEERDEVVFISQPLKELFSDHLGYDEYTVLSDLSNVIKSAKAPLTLRLRLHPKEANNKFDALLRGFSFPWSVDSSSHSAGLLRRNKRLVGMHSAFLIEAYLAGMQPIVYQPGVRISHPFEKFTNILTEPLQLSNALLDPAPQLRDPSATFAERYRHLGMPSGSIDKIYDTVMELL